MSEKAEGLTLDGMWLGQAAAREPDDQKKKTSGDLLRPYMCFPGAGMITEQQTAFWRM